MDHRPSFASSARVKADLHLHSRHSARAQEWFFRKVGLADSYSDPVATYERLRAAGMDFVTFTDHNRIDGCLQIAGRPGAFVSVQVSSRFPEDRTKVHLLVWGITERQHQDLQKLRENLYEMQRYLVEEQLVHAVAHPFYRPNEPLSLAQVEKLMLLFKHFEGVNGLRDRLLSDVTRHVLSGLTPKKIEQLAERHGIAPAHAEPWKKAFIGGSDDHGGLRPGKAFTETPPAADAREFLEHVRAGRCDPRGDGGT